MDLHLESRNVKMTLSSAKSGRMPRGRREPITARMVADLMQAVGIDHVLTMDLYVPQKEGFFHAPVDSLPAVPTVKVSHSQAKVTHEAAIVMKEGLIAPVPGGVEGHVDPRSGDPPWPMRGEIP